MGARRTARRATLRCPRRDGAPAPAAQHGAVADGRAAEATPTAGGGSKLPGCCVSTTAITTAGTVVHTVLELGIFGCRPDRQRAGP